MQVPVSPAENWVVHQQLNDSTHPLAFTGFRKEGMSMNYVVLCRVQHVPVTTGKIPWEFPTSSITVPHRDHCLQSFLVRKLWQDYIRIKHYSLQSWVFSSTSTQYLKLLLVWLVLSRIFIEIIKYFIKPGINFPRFYKGGSSPSLLSSLPCCHQCCL